MGTKNGFAFIVHSRDVSDLYRKYPIARFFPKFILELICKYKHPIIVSKITGLKSKRTGEEIPGWIIGCPITAKQMLRDRKLAQKRIFQAVKLAEKKGVKLIGLGALTASLTKGGNDIAENFKNLNFTSGHAGTAFSVTQTVKAIVQRLERKFSNLNIAVVGAAGSIGSISAKILAKEMPKNILLVDVHRKRQTMIEIEREIKKLVNIHIDISCEINAINDADIIIAATNSPEVVIRPEHLKKGAVVVNDAQPSDVSNEVYKRNDVLVLEGGVMFFSGINYHFNMGLSQKEDIFSCLAEVLALTLKGIIRSYTLGKVSMEQVNEMGSFFKDLEIKISRFQNIKGIIDGDKINRIKNNQ